MFYALSRGVPEAGIVFAAAMMIGVGLTLAAVALLTVVARDRLALISARHGASIDRLTRVLDGLSGVLLISLSAFALRS